MASATTSPAVFGLPATPFSHDSAAIVAAKRTNRSTHRRLYERIVAFRCRVCRHVCTSVSDIVFHVRAMHRQPRKYCTSTSDGTVSAPALSSDNGLSANELTLHSSNGAALPSANSSPLPSTNDSHLSLVKGVALPSADGSPLCSTTSSSIPSSNDLPLPSADGAARASAADTSAETTAAERLDSAGRTDMQTFADNTSVVVVRGGDTGAGSVSFSAPEAEVFVCSQCGKTYRSLSACKHHMNRHKHTINNMGKLGGSASSGVSLLKEICRNSSTSELDADTFRPGTVSAVTFASTSDDVCGDSETNHKSDPTSELLVCSQPLCRRQFASQQQLLVHEQCHMVSPASQLAELSASGVESVCDSNPRDGTCSGTARSLFSCCKCSLLTAASWSRVLTHLWRSHAIDAGLAHCTRCQFRCALEANMTRHVRVRHTPARHMCRRCGARFRRSDQLYNHQLTHAVTPTDPAGISSDLAVTSIDCGVTPTDHGVTQTDVVVTQTDLAGTSTDPSMTQSHRHLSPGQRRRLCVPCRRLFSSVSALRAHHRVRHERVHGVHCCPVCSHTAATRHLLRLHVRGHSGERPLVCSAATTAGCTFRTCDPSALKKHQLRHTSIRPYSCSLCSYRAIQSAALKSHVRRHHGGAGLHCCRRCDFSSVSALRLHMHEAARSCGDRAAPAGDASLVGGDGGAVCTAGRQQGQYVFQIVPDEPTEDRGGITIPAGEENGSLLSQFSG